MALSELDSQHILIRQPCGWKKKDENSLPTSVYFEIKLSENFSSRAKQAILSCIDDPVTSPSATDN